MNRAADRTAKQSAKRLAYQSAKGIVERHLKQMPSAAGEPRPVPSRPVLSRPEPIQTRDLKSNISRFWNGCSLPRCAVVARAYARGEAA